MKIRRGRNKPIVETQMISLADIAFLIIFFFMFTSSFMREKFNVKVPELPRSGKSEAAAVVVIDKEGAMYLNGQPIGSSSALERELTSLLRDKIGSQTEVRLMCDKSLPYKSYRGVYEAISRAGGIIAIMHDLPK